MKKVIHNEKSDISYEQMVKVLCETAKVGLAKYYSNASSNMPYIAGLDEARQWKSEGISHRYAAISQIGIARWITEHPDQQGQIPDLWPRISDNIINVKHIGDAALSLWAGVMSGANDCDKYADLLVECWQGQRLKCNAVELGWVVQACTVAIDMSEDFQSKINPILEVAHKDLTDLFNSEHGLFQRHNRNSIRELITKRIACFADQVYPIVALSTYGRVFDDKQSIDMAARAVEQICNYQGDLGQWQWHYDVPGQKLCEEYPVFSVHQDSMAPMAIFASDRTSGNDHSNQVYIGLKWLFGCNELKKNLVLDKDGLVWRDIERKEPNLMTRTIRGLCCLSGLNGLHRKTGYLCKNFKVNYECRPYHLGWILYAWAEKVKLGVVNNGCSL